MPAVRGTHWNPQHFTMGVMLSCNTVHENSIRSGLVWRLLCVVRMLSVKHHLPIHPTKKTQATNQPPNKPQTKTKNPKQTRTPLPNNKQTPKQTKQQPNQHNHKQKAQNKQKNTSKTHKQQKQTKQACKWEFNLIQSVASLACNYTLAFSYVPLEQSQCILTKSQSPVTQKWTDPECLCFVMENGYTMIFRLVVLVVF